MLKKTYDVLEKESLIKAKSFKELKNDFNVLKEESLILKKESLIKDKSFEKLNNDFNVLKEESLIKDSEFDQLEYNYYSLMLAFILVIFEMSLENSKIYSLIWRIRNILSKITDRRNSLSKITDRIILWFFRR